MPSITSIYWQLTLCTWLAPALSIHYHSLLYECVSRRQALADSCAHLLGVGAHGTAHYSLWFARVWACALWSVTLFTNCNWIGTFAALALQMQSQFEQQVVGPGMRPPLPRCCPPSVTYGETVPNGQFPLWESDTTPSRVSDQWFMRAVAPTKHGWIPLRLPDGGVSLHDQHYLRFIMDHKTHFVSQKDFSGLQNWPCTSQKKNFVPTLCFLESPDLFPLNYFRFEAPDS